MSSRHSFRRRGRSPAPRRASAHVVQRHVPRCLQEMREHLVVAVRAADAGEALVQIAALEKSRRATRNDRAPEAVLGLKPLVVDLLEGLEMLVQQTPQFGGLRIAATVQRQRLDTRAPSWQERAANQ